MRKKARCVGSLVLAVLAVAVLLVAVFPRLRTTVTLTRLPEEAATVVEHYCNAAEVNFSEVQPFTYFPLKEMQEHYANSSQQLTDWQLVAAEQINENLYALTLRIKSEDVFEDNKWHRIWNFVGCVDGAWRYMVGVGFIPDTISEGLDLSKYDYQDNSFPLLPEACLDQTEPK